jgi:hypothetical protein
MNHPQLEHQLPISQDVSTRISHSKLGLRVLGDFNNTHLKLIAADEVTTLPKLAIQPTQCVSMRQGQDCFVNVDVSWQVVKKGDYSRLYLNPVS